LAEKATAGTIRVGIGGWTYEPWRGGMFYPKGHPQARELQYASGTLTAIEINGTFYGSQKPASFIKWAEETPDDFVFSMKAPRFAVNRRILAEAGPSIEKFFSSGVHHLKSKLGPILWQFAPHKKYEPDDFAKFMDLLPKKVEGLKLRHAIEVRHESFMVPEFMALLRKHNAAVVYAHHNDYPEAADVTSDFAYGRLQSSIAKVETGYTAADLKKWAARAKDWSEGKAPKDLTTVTKQARPEPTDVFLFFISGAKERNPAAAQALIKALRA
jgi:uncharacterized protein YecE (DUF72 family)